MVAAWGALLQPWSTEVAQRLRYTLSTTERRGHWRQLWCLGKNGDGSPKHPPDLTDEEKAELASRRASYRKPATPWMTAPGDLLAELAEEPAAVVRGALEER